MPIHLVRPVSNIDLADTEHKLRGISGCRISPSSCGVSVHNLSRKQLSYNYRGIILHRLYQITKEGGLIGEITNWETKIPIRSIPDLPLLYPPVQVAYSKPLSPGDRERLGLSHGRMSGKNSVYTLHTPTFDRITQCARASNSLPGWKAPSGFASINSFRAFILVRRLISGFIGSQDIGTILLPDFYENWAETYMTTKESHEDAVRSF